MELIDFIVGLIQNNSYIIVFILMILQGALITAIASFMASLGLFNIWYILGLAILGNLIPDFLFFILGRYMRKDSVEKFISRVGVNKSNIIFLEKNIKNHLKKAIVLIKVTPFLPMPGIMLAGFLKVPFKRFFSISIIVDIVTISIAAIIGFYSGLLGNNILKILELERFLLPISIILILILVWITRKFYAYVMTHIKKLIV